MADIAKLKLVKARIQAKLDASKAAGTYVSAADHQAAWERKVAAAMPRIEVGQDDGNDSLVEQLATSVERQAVVNYLVAYADSAFSADECQWLCRAIDVIERGEHR